MRLEHIQSNTKEIEVKIQGEKLAIVYRPASITPRMRRESMSAIKGGEQDSIDMLIKNLITLIKSWDLVETLNGEELPYPLTDERLQDLPIDFIVKITTSIFEDLELLGEKNGTMSATISQ